MKTSRPDILQAKLIQEKFDIESINHKDLHRIFFDSIVPIFNNKEFFGEYKISTEMKGRINFLFNMIESFYNGEISEKDLESYGNAAWKEHDQAKGPYKDILRAIIPVLGSIEEEVRDYGSDYFLGFMFGYFRMFDEKYCEMLRKNMERHPLMQKYRINNFDQRDSDD